MMTGTSLTSSSTSLVRRNLLLPFEVEDTLGLDSSCEEICAGVRFLDAFYERPSGSFLAGLLPEVDDLRSIPFSFALSLLS